MERPRFSGWPARRESTGLAIDEREQADEIGAPAGKPRIPRRLCLGGLADVAMVQATDFGKLHDLPRRRELDRPEVRRVLVEGEVGARLMVIGEVAGQDAAEVALAEDEYVIQALTPDRADESFRERILPRAVRCRKHLLDPHALQAMPKLLTVDAIAVAEEVARRRVVWEGVHDLLGGPLSGGVCRHVEVDGAPTVMS